MFTPASVMLFVRDFALHAEGWMFEYRSRPKTSSGSSTDNCAVTCLNVTYSWR